MNLGEISASYLSTLTTFARHQTTGARIFEVQESKKEGLEINLRWDRVGPLKEKQSDLSSLAAAQSVFHCTAQKRLVEQHREHLRDYEQTQRC